MLVLSRKKNEKILIDGGRIAVGVVEIRGDKVRLGVDAPAEVRIDREEVHAQRSAVSDQQSAVSEETRNRWVHDGCIQTRSGVRFSLVAPRPEDVRIEDVAHALARQCRFVGHTAEFYSVAQHSIYVAHILPDELKLAGLLHDAAEAYLGDISRPLKRLLGDAWRRIAAPVEAAVAAAFGLAWPPPADVHQADEILLVTEARDQMGGELAEELRGLATPDRDPISGWPASMAADLFLMTYQRLAAAETGKGAA